MVAKSIEGFIAAAETSGKNLREFSEWIGKADAFAAARRTKNLVLVECVANAKGKEFDHVILPFLENGEFPNPLADRHEEENLFYVAATRAKSRLTLISPTDVQQRSPFIRQMKLSSSLARANLAVEKNWSNIASAPTRFELSVHYLDKDAVKALGAQWDGKKRVWYVGAGADLVPFKQWLPRGTV